MKKIVLGMTCVAVLLAPTVSYSQEDSEVTRLTERLIALEQRLYRNSASGTPSNLMIAEFEARLQTIEEESQKLYGAVEELGYTVSQFSQKMDMMSKDFDLRISDLEKEVETLKANPQPAKVEPTAAKTERKPATSAQASVSIPANLTPEDMYSKAYHLLVATNYVESEAWMKEFIKRNPTHELADNAHYWLGEIYLVQDMSQKAVVSFSTGLAQFPKGAKAPANLLKMGVAFKRMNKDDFAKSAWEKLIAEYASSPEADKARSELEKLKA